MQCEDVRELLGNYIDEELTEAMRSRVEEHMGECAACAGDLQSLSETVARLQTTPAPEAPNSWHFERLLDRLARDHDAPLANPGAPAKALSQLSFNITTDEEESYNG